MEKTDNTDTRRKLRRTRSRIPGVMYKTRLWFEIIGAERIPQKSITRSAYKKQMMEYWATLCPTYLERAQRMRVYVKTRDNDD